MNSYLKQARVGFGIMVLEKGKVLLGRRNSNPVKAESELHGEGTWGLCLGEG